MNQKAIFYKYMIWKEGHSSVKREFVHHVDVLFCGRSNCEDYIGEMVGPLFTWTDLNKITNLINERGINCNYESISAIDSFVTSTHQTHGNEAKTFFKISQTLMMKELDVHIGGNTVWARAFPHDFVGKIQFVIVWNNNVSFN